MQEVILTAGGSDMRCLWQAPRGTVTDKAIIVLAEAFGVNSHIQSVVSRFVDAGYAAIAPELYHHTAPKGFVCGYGDFAQASPHFMAITAEHLQQDVQACMDFLATKGYRDFAVIGYCLGGRAAFIANAACNLKAAISFYGGRIVPQYLPLCADQRAPLMLVWAGKDTHIPAEQTAMIHQGLRSAGKDFTVVEFAAADHGFFCDERAAYQKSAAVQSWSMVLRFLEQHL